MAEKKVNKARIIMKHDTEENWLKATNFIPLDSEIIVYDADATNTIPRIKVGDGVTNVNALPFITEELENKVDKVEGKGLSTNDYTDDEAAKVAAAASLNIKNGTHTGSIKTSGATNASANYSFAEGRNTTASGIASHAEGNSTTASGDYSHAEGNSATASGDYSHAGGQHTIVKGACGTAIGKYNLDPDSGENTLVPQSNISHIFFSSSYKTTYTQPTISIENGIVTSTNTSYLTPDKFQVGMYVINNTVNEPGYFKILSTPVLNGSYYYAIVDSYLITLAKTTLGTYAFSVGNGASNSMCSNAHTLDWDGNSWYAGDVYVGGTGQDDATTKKLATEEYVDNAVANNEVSTEGLATEEYVNNAIANLVDSSPETLNTLNELSAALGDDPNFATTVTNQIAEKANKNEVATNIKNGPTSGSIVAGSALGEVNDYIIGEDAFSEGINTIATGAGAHSEGELTTAIGEISHVEGSQSIAYGKYSHAEGSITIAYGESSHAEGGRSILIILLTGEENATTYTYTTTSEVDLSEHIGRFIALFPSTPSQKALIESATSTTVTLSKTLSSTAITNKTAFVYLYGAIGDYSHSEGFATTAKSNSSHAEGNSTMASGSSSHAEGGSTAASGECSHAEGYGTTASGRCAHAEGSSTVASEEGSHAEGYGTTASGYYAHAEGIDTVASGYYSHVEGNTTIAASMYQHAQGKYNIEDTEDNYAHIVGNGTADSARSNAHTLDWDGTAWFQGNVLVGGTGQDDTNAKQLATQEYVNERVPKFTYSTVDLEAGVSPLAEGEVYFVYE